MILNAIIFFIIALLWVIADIDIGHETDLTAAFIIAFFSVWNFRQE